MARPKTLRFGKGTRTALPGRSEPRLILRLLAALCCLPAAGYGGGVGVLVARTAVEPPRIKPGDKATVGVETRDGFQRPLDGVSIKITADSGFFESSHERTVQGSTDPRGQFRAVWQSDRRAEPGAREFSIIASKSGYLGRYPLTASVIVETAPEKQPDLSGKPLPDRGKKLFDLPVEP